MSLLCLLHEICTKGFSTDTKTRERILHTKGNKKDDIISSKEVLWTVSIMFITFSFADFTKNIKKNYMFLFFHIAKDRMYNKSTKWPVTSNLLHLQNICQAANMCFNRY